MVDIGQYKDIVEVHPSDIKDYPGWTVLLEYNEPVVYYETSVTGSSEERYKYEPRVVLGLHGGIHKALHDQKLNIERMQNEAIAFKRASQSTIDELRRNLEEERERTESYAYRLKTCEKALDLARDSVQQLKLLENDLAKVRKAIGDVAYNDIIKKD